MKALFSRMRHGKKDKDSDNRSLREKAQPPLPVDDSSSLATTPDLSSRELPPLNTDSDESGIHSAIFNSSGQLVQPDLPPLPADNATPPLPLRPSNGTPEPQSLQVKISTRPRVDLDTSSATLMDPAISKKVAFVSPPPTPAAILARNVTRDSTDGTPFARGSVRSPAPSTVPTTRSVSAPNTPRHPLDTPRHPALQISSAKSPASLDIQKASTTFSTGSRTGHSPVQSVTPRSHTASAALEGVSVRSGSPMSYMSGRTGLQAAASWSEAAEGDLVSNLGPRERTRQEVLWEIVASEDRYVVELLKLKETFIDPLLHPFSSAPITSATLVDSADDFYFRSDSPHATPNDSLDALPIASRFLSSNPALRPPRSAPPQSEGASGSRTPVIPPADGESVESEEEEDQLGRGYASGKNKVPIKFGSQHSPYGSGVTRTGKPLPFPTRSHHSLPPPPRQNPQASTTSLGRQSVLLPFENERRPATAAPSRLGRMLHKKNNSASENPENGSGLPPHLLPEDLRECLEVLENTILNGHLILAEGLRKRYEEQYPLVRSLADVFVSNSHILRGYATYVLHLERALEQVDNALSNVNLTKKPKKQDIADWIHVSKVLKQLEDTAADKGETGLAISLSKPFQRLLKYPLLFQNLLFHTDPSTFEYESTLHMVAEVEKIVRSIEDEKIQKEERDKTRDALARIEGLEKNKALAAPKASRQLMQERPLVPPATQSNATPPPTGGKPAPSSNTSPAAGASKTVHQKSSFRRLSDVLQPGGTATNPTVGGKKDLWLVVFNDVVLRCQRTGTTTLPLASTTASRAHSLPEMQGKGKYSTVSRRSLHTKPRNLYKLIKIETWNIGDILQPREGVVAMEDITRTRTKLSTTQTLEPSAEAPEEEAEESDDSDRKSKMSFSYWGADKITVRPSAVKPKSSSAAKPAATQPPRRPNAPSSYSTANAKFGTRLRSPEPSDTPGARPASRRQAPTPANAPSVRKTSGDSAKPPAWGSPGAARQNQTSLTPGAKRTLKLSAPTPPKPTSSKLPPASPAPSELTLDSGVGFYRDVIAQNPSLNRSSNTSNL